MKIITFFTSFFLFIVVGLNAQCPLSDKAGIHVVQQNENLYRISVNYGVSIKQLCDWNSIKVIDNLDLCQELIVADYAATSSPTPSYTTRTQAVPSSYDYKPQPPREEVITSKGSYETTPTSYNNNTTYRKQKGNKHVVQSGETVATLARLYGYTEERFREFNVLGDRELTPGSSVLSTDCSCPRVSYDEGPDDYGYIENGDPWKKTERGYGYGQNTYNTGNTGSTYTETPTTQPNTSPQPKGPKTQSSTSNTGVGGSNNPKPAPPAGKAKANYMQNLELQMIDEINLMRSNPSGYVQYVQEYADRQKNTGGFAIGQAALSSLISDLQNSPQLSHLQPSRCIYSAAQKHGSDCLSMGSMEHKGSDGKWPWDRVLRECSSMTDGNENLVGGPDNVRESVIILLIDDGIPGYGHRKTLMRADWQYVACYKVGQVGDMPNCWVQKFGK